MAKELRCPHCGKVFIPPSNGRVFISELRVALEIKKDRRERLFKYRTEGPLGHRWDSEVKRLEFVEVCRQIRELERKIEDAACT